MKVVNSTIIILFSYFSCTECPQENRRAFSDNISYINYDADTLAYQLTVNDTLGEEVYMVTRQIFVDDSCFGILNDGGRNKKRARLYANDTKKNYHYRYNVSVKENDGHIKRIWTIIDNYFWDQTYITLDQRKDFGDDLFLSSSNFLRVIQKYKTENKFKCLNFIINKNHTWRLLSKEMIDFGYFSATINSSNPIGPFCEGYEIDSISQNTSFFELGSIDTIIFLNAFKESKYWQRLPYLGENNNMKIKKTE